MHSRLLGTNRGGSVFVRQSGQTVSQTSWSASLRHCFRLVARNIQGRLRLRAAVRTNCIPRGHGFPDLVSPVPAITAWPGCLGCRGFLPAATAWFGTGIRGWLILVLVGGSVGSLERGGPPTRQRPHRGVGDQYPGNSDANIGP
jgi:hypothetical protein